MNAPRLLVLAVDGADPHVIKRHLSRLPTLARLCAEGAHGLVESTIHSCDIWMTHYTGLSPDQHGVVALRLIKATAPTDRTHVKTDVFLWDWVNQYGLTTGFVEPLYTYPAPTVDGFFLAGPPRPTLVESAEVMKPAEMAPLVGMEYTASIPFPLSLRDLGIETPFAQVPDETLLRILQNGYNSDFPERIRPNLNRYVDMVLRLYERRPVDLLWVYFLEADIIGHFGFHEPSLDTLVRTYAELDTVFAKLIDRLQPEHVLVVSDHGMAPIADLFHKEQTVDSMRYLAWEYGQTAIRHLTPQISVLEGANKGLCTGTHHYQAFYALQGAGVHRGAIADIHYHDVFKMVLGTLGLPIPNGRAGKTPQIFHHFTSSRASLYDRLQWATDNAYLDAYLSFADLHPEHRVLEAGVGTGQVAARARNRVASVVGVDSSPDMIAIATKKLPGVTLVEADLQHLPVPDASFDRILARSVLHHVTHGLHDALCELHRVLRPGGRLVIGEGIPPSPASVHHFTEVFRLKEERLVLLPEHLVQMLEAIGFVDIRFAKYVMPQVSVRNWLEQSDLTPELRERLLLMHRNTSPAVQRDYRTTRRGDDVLIDFTFALVSGRRAE